MSAHVDFENHSRRDIGKTMEELLEGFAVTWGLMLPQFDRDVFDTSPEKIAKVDNLHIHWKKDRQSPGILTDNLAKLTMALVKKLPPSLSIFGYYGFS